jgi:hypothetical protein
MSFQRPTSLADAFITAACKTKGVNPDKGTGNWIARRSIINAARPGFGIVTERDKTPPKPTTLKPEALKQALSSGFEQVFTAAASPMRPFLTDEEIHGID